jgi:hypothetical protein
MVAVVVVAAAVAAADEVAVASAVAADGQEGALAAAGCRVLRLRWVGRRRSAAGRGLVAACHDRVAALVGPAAVRARAELVVLAARVRAVLPEVDRADDLRD